MASGAKAPSFASADGGGEDPPFRTPSLPPRSSKLEQRARHAEGPASSAKNRSLSASRARQIAAGKKKRGTPCGMTRNSRLRRSTKPRRERASSLGLLAG